MHEKNEKKLRLKQYRLIQRNVKYFQDVSMARRMPLAFRCGNGVVTIESDEVAYLELLKDAYKLTNEYESVSFFSRGGWGEAPHPKKKPGKCVTPCQANCQLDRPDCHANHTLAVSMTRRLFSMLPC